ncbi:hypothetical protein M501DRAFT_998376 [Patellaria atrata CBS 101060]|uniref:DC-UbP/UBTD2 N-terminal domain-containing protein n=1 Tax=Patellaria atrata CBS 101060 TaxID=1346257 RepID=A0A9P4VQP2_9PEZI|nr:hypothetical protein M501DRAFT_998376 [Patellaria atrata CBS 101060]
MGCCTSRPRSSNSSPYNNTTPNSPIIAGDSSRANITSHTQSPPHSQSFVSHATHTLDTPRSSHHLPRVGGNLGRAPNAPLRFPTYQKKCEAPHKAHWTPSQLRKEREEFFETRVTGQAEIWGVVRLVAELVRARDLEEAQGILDAAGCTCPTGDIWKGVFDERGQFYQVPEWIVRDPDGMLEEVAEDKDLHGDATDEDEDGDKELLEHKEEKGKGRAVDVGEIMKVRARLSDRGTDVIVKIGKEEKLSVLIKRVKEIAGLPPKTKIKIAYLGKILHENESLSAQGWREGHVLNTLIF